MALSKERKRRIWLFLYSNGNIAGCLAGLVGISLYLIGVIDKGWFYITTGLYLAGYFAVPARDALKVRANISVDSLRDVLEELIRDTRKRLPTEAVALLESISGRMAGILPRLAELKANLPMDTPHSFTVAETVMRYLPDVLDGYLKLPPMYAVAHHIDGQTPKQHLLEQLRLLDGKLADISDDLFRSDAEALARNGRFLEEKFRT